MADTTSFKNGVVLKIDNKLQQIVEFQHVKPGKGPAFVRTKLKDVMTGKVTDKTFDQVELDAEKFGRAVDFLLENMRIQVSFHDNEPLFAELPINVDLKVEHTEPGLQGDRSNGGTKPATLETGAEVQVPLFIETGNVVKIDTRTGDYLSRSNN